MEERDGLLYRVKHDPQLGEICQLLAPAVLRPKVLHALHDHMGHQGEERTLNLVKRRVYWPGMQTCMGRVL